MRIGVLLGPPAPGERTDRNPSPTNDGLTPNQRSEFRRMAADPDTVEDVIADSTDEGHVLELNEK